MYWLLSKIMPPAHVLIAENLHHTCPASPHCASEVELLLGTPQNWQSVGCKFPASSLQVSAATHHKTRQQLRKLNFLGLTMIEILKCDWRGFIDGMGGVNSIPAVVGQLATRLLYYLSGYNYYNRQSFLTQPGPTSENQLLLRWRGKDFHVYDRMG